MIRLCLYIIGMDSTHLRSPSLHHARESIMSLCITGVLTLFTRLRWRLLGFYTIKLLFLSSWLNILGEILRDCMIFCFCLNFCPLILASLHGFCLEQLPLWCSNGDFSFPLFLLIHSLEFFYKEKLSLLSVCQFVYSFSYLFILICLMGIYSLGYTNAVSLLVKLF